MPKKKIGGAAALSLAELVREHMEPITGWTELSYMGSRNRGMWRTKPNTWFLMNNGEVEVVQSDTPPSDALVLIGKQVDTCEDESEKFRRIASALPERVPVTLGTARLDDDTCVLVQERCSAGTAMDVINYIRGGWNFQKALADLRTGVQEALAGLVQILCDDPVIHELCGSVTSTSDELIDEASSDDLESAIGQLDIPAQLDLVKQIHKRMQDGLQGGGRRWTKKQLGGAGVMGRYAKDILQERQNYGILIRVAEILRRDRERELGAMICSEYALNAYNPETLEKLLQKANTRPNLVKNAIEEVGLEQAVQDVLNSDPVLWRALGAAAYVENFMVAHRAALLDELFTAVGLVHRDGHLYNFVCEFVEPQTTRYSSGLEMPARIPMPDGADRHVILKVIDMGDVTLDVAADKKPQLDPICFVNPLSLFMDNVIPGLQSEELKLELKQGSLQDAATSLSIALDTFSTVGGGGARRRRRVAPAAKRGGKK